MFSDGKLGIFRKVEEIMLLRGGVVLYATQGKAQTDGEIEKGRFPSEN